MTAAKLIGYAWASPWTVLASLAIPVALVTRGRVALHTGVIEIAGGGLGRILPRIGPGIAAVTIGHCVLAVDQRELDRTRSHERVHVGQFERWGVLFPFLYGAASVAAWRQGRHYYFDNRFEAEARRLAASEAT